MKKITLLTIAAVMVMTNVLGQQAITWKATDTIELPKGITYLQSEGMLYDSIPLSAHCLLIDFSEGKFKLEAAQTTGFKTPSQFSSLHQQEVYACINGGFFSKSASVSLIIDKGQVLAENPQSLSRPKGQYFPTRAAFGIDKRGNMAIHWVYHTAKGLYAYEAPAPNQLDKMPLEQPDAKFPSKGKKWQPYVAMGAGPVLLKNTEPVTMAYELFPEDIMDSVAPRTAIGYTADGHLVMLVVDGRQQGKSEGVTLAQLALLMKELGCKDAMNLDGGGSSAMVVKGKLVNTPSDKLKDGSHGKERAVKSVLMLSAAKDL
ncbi:phosphodiester glycosidase family protein [Limibacter armeniacum]|uniref:phosphodiester glycosidase family protein n=1 Tax=Limibacter armeniacum TaxID=466084 RepID=UPI002FE5D63B